MDEKTVKHYTYSEQIMESLKINWIFILIVTICTSLISKENIIIRTITIYAIGFYSYFSHQFLHLSEDTFLSNIFTYGHDYHHNNDGTTFWFVKSFIIECLLEFIGGFSIIIFFLPLYYFHGIFFLDLWIILFHMLSYISVHNINYSILHLSKNHYNHHKNVYTSFGPDYCDILFGTKHPEDDIEDLTHTIPNVLLSTAIVLLLQYLYKRYTL